MTSKEIVGFSVQLLPVLAIHLHFQFLTIVEIEQVQSEICRSIDIITHPFLFKLQF